VVSNGDDVNATLVPYVDPVRVAALRRRSLRASVIATVSTAGFLAVVGFATVNAPGWPSVHYWFLDGEAFRASFPAVARAFVLNVKIFLVAEVFILVLSLVVALVRVSKAPVLVPLRFVATVFTDVFRGTPTLLVVYLLGFGLPALEIKGLPTDPVVWGTIALILSYTAYVAEVFRAGIRSVHPSQRAAARSLGLNVSQTMRHVVLPQAVRRIAPPLLNDFVSLQKDTALVSILGPIEALRAAQIYASSKFNYTSVVVAALLFIALTIPLARFTDWLGDRQERRDRGADS
jgi:polar amino acid transport system permease protein